MESQFGMKRPDQVKAAPDQGERVPPGQFLIKKIPVLTYGSTPKVDLKSWKIRVFGLVEQEVELDWDQFSKLEWVRMTADFHCVTQWSSLDNTWEGATFAGLVRLAKPLPQANFVMAHCFGNYTTNMPLDVAMDEGLLVHRQNGRSWGETTAGPYV